MGWTYTYRSCSTKEFFERAFNHDDGKGRSGKVLRFSATWNVAYMAYEVKYPAIPEGTKDSEGKLVPARPANREVIALVCLIHHCPKAEWNFGYKDMEECMGPCERRCPKTILNLLTPTTEKTSLEWRKDCWDRIHKKENQPKVSPGDWVKFSKEMEFTNGAKADTFQFRNGSGFCTQYGERVRISHWREKEFTNLGQKRVQRGELVAV